MIPGVGIFIQRSELNQPLKLALFLLLILALSRGMVLLYHAFDSLFPGASVVSQALGLGVGLGITSQFIVRRKWLKQRFGNRAYSIGLRWIATPGLTIVAVAFAHFAWIEGEPVLRGTGVTLVAAYLIVSGLLIWYRALRLFGLDTLAIVYVYYPSEGRMIRSDIYGVVRHPIYSAVIRLCFALALLNGSVLAVLGALMAPLAMWLWVHYGEEPELMERFGEEYRAYRTRVPAFFNFDPRSWPSLWRFALVGH